MPPTPPIDYVRVKAHDTKHEYTIVRSAYEADPDQGTIIDKPATSTDGTPLPPKHYIAPESLSSKRPPAEPTT